MTSRRAPRLPTTSPVPWALVLIALQLLYRAWATYRSWYVDDDYAFISRMFEHGVTAKALLGGYSGHFMPGGFLATWLLQSAWPFQFAAVATTMLVLQAIADLGMLHLLRTMFGDRTAILVPLGLFLLTSFTIPQAVWWAIAVNQLPYLIAFCWGLAAYVCYLRSRRWLDLLRAFAWVVAGMLFYEKAVLIPVAMMFVALAYFAEGDLWRRIGSLWSRHRAATLAFSALILGYAAVYLHYAAIFGASKTLGSSLPATLENVVLHCWLVGVLGGPLRWFGETPGAQFSDASTLVILLAGLCLAMIVRELVRARTASARALWLPVVFLVMDGVLVTGGRSTLAGPVFGLDFRYVGEMSLVTAVALGCALLPIPGAADQVGWRAPSRFLDVPRRVITVCAVCAGLAVYSTSVYVNRWHDHQSGTPYMRTLLADMGRLDGSTPVVDGELPAAVMWPLDFPGNKLSRVIRPRPAGLRFATWANDHLLAPGPTGHLEQVAVTPTRRGLSAGGAQCAHKVDQRTRTIALDGQVMFGVWWVRVGYIASADSDITVTAGGLTQHARVRQGLHVLYFATGTATFDTITLGGMSGDAFLCTDDVTVGRPVAEDAS